MMRVNFFSPLPPLPTEIANHTATILPALAQRCDLRVYTAQAEWNVPEDGFVIRRFDPQAMRYGALHEAEINVYNLGNNADFHQPIFEVARRVPGIVLLHDTRLQHFFGRYLITEGEARDYYLHALEGLEGPRAVAQARRYLAGELPFDTLVESYPMTLAATEHALAAILHNAHDAVALGARAACPVFPLDLAARIAAPFPRPKPRRDGALRLIMFGFIGRNRRLEPVMRAIADMKECDRIRLDLYGMLEDPDELPPLIARHGLGAIVTHHGYVAQSVLDEALHAADLAINLRYPSMGEASASQLRIWGAALPSLVTRTGWYGALPDDCVFFVDPATEIADIQRHLRACLRRPRRYAAAGQAGRIRLERRHTPEQYADGLMAVLQQHAMLHARLHAKDLARHIMHRALDVMDTASLRRLASPIAHALHDLVTPA